MSSMSSNSDAKKSKGPGEFILTWSIHNYSYCTLNENEALESPEFVVDFLGKEKFWLRLYPRMNYCLNGMNQNSAWNFKLSFRKANGQFQDEDFPTSFCNGYRGNQLTISFPEQLKEIDGSYVVDDTLTLRCRIWKTDVAIPTSVNLNVHSRIIISKLDYTWILSYIDVSNNAFIISNQSKQIKKFFVNISSLKIHLLNEWHSGKNFMNFGIEIADCEKSFISFFCVIHLLDKNGRVAHSARGEHLFYEDSKAGEIWSFPIISKDKLYSNKNLYVHEGRLTIQCEISFSSDNELETFVYRRTDIEERADLLEQSPGVQELWIGNMHECLLGGKFSDFIIRTPKKQFPVHKAILSAHSQVFCAMLERGMAESNSGFVAIQDLSEDTVCQMLTFLYTNTIKELNCASAQELYFAADKYRIEPLLKKCSNYLLCSLDTANVCDILAIADRHQDQELKSGARDFIEAHTHEIIVSEGWNKLILTNPHLTIYVLQSIVCNKLL